MNLVIEFFKELLLSLERRREDTMTREPETLNKIEQTITGATPNKVEAHNNLYIQDQNVMNIGGLDNQDLSI